MKLDVERFLKQFMVVLLTLRADCSLFTLKSAHLSPYLPQMLAHLITHVATTEAPRTDEAMTEQIQQELHQADLVPAEHLVDAGYVSARVLVKSQERFGIEGVGPVSVDTQWQAHTPSGIDGSTVRP